MNIAMLCKRPIVSIDAGATVRQAARLMREAHVGALVVTAERAEGPVAAGIVTDRDLALEVLAGDAPSLEAAVGSVAQSPLVGMPAGTGLGEAVAMMATRGVRRLLVTDDAGRLIGLVSADDLFEALSGELAGLSRVLRLGLAREASERGATPAAPPRPVFLPYGTPGLH